MSSKNPKFSVVVPLFRTEAYLGDLLRSLEEQKSGNYSLEFIFVDDGSDDQCGAMAQAWLERTALVGEVIRQENAGVAAARNTGIEAAQGDWVTFPDSDDFLSADYFAEAAKALAGVDKSVVLMSANVFRFDEHTQKKSDEHPLRHKFESGQTLVDLRDVPGYIQTQTASAFFRVDIIREHNVRFVHGLRVAEDAMFASTYLLSTHAPLALPLKKSIYYYRRRSAADSAADTYRTNPDFYFGRFERGYIPLLALAESKGDIPQWLQNIILYDLSWLFPREMNVERKATHLTAEEQARVIVLLGEVLKHVQAASIISYRMTTIAPEVRALMLTLGGMELPPTGSVRLSKNVAGAFEISYLYQGEVPTEIIESNGRPVTPIVQKTRRLDYFGQQLLSERIIRLPQVTSLTISLDGELQLLQYGNYYYGSAEAKPVSGAKRVGRKSSATPLWKQAAIRGASELVCWTRVPIKKPKIAKDGLKLRRKRFRAFIQNLAKTPKYTAKFDGAWLIMDKLRAGNDNGEYLYEYLKENRPDINAWFVLEEGTPEWDRLKKAGAKLLAFRSIEHRVALLLAKVVASSHLALEIVQPISIDFYPGRTRPWRFVYLQHGVLQHNLAHWFNTKDIDILTTASVDEHESIIVDGGTYRLTSESVKLTGFPRHDVITRLAKKYPFATRPVILVAPTWRNNLFLPKTHFGAQRKLRAPFLQTEYGRNWMEFLSHPKLKGLAEQYGAEIVYLPHPNLRGNMEGVVFPPHVTVIESTPNIHELMSRARVTITDYSSIFFDAALANSRIVYFQFDQQEFIQGGHTYVPGYWDYEKHGLGPVEITADGAASLVVRAYEPAGESWSPMYEERLVRTLPKADGQSAQRIVREIEDKFQF